MNNHGQEQIILYMHAGSANHGCEAIVNSLCHMLHEDTILVSYRGAEDERYTLKDLCRIKQERSFSSHKIAHLFYYIYRMITKDETSFIRYRYEEIFRKPMSPLAISIGGDNYCYDSMLLDLRLTNQAFCERGTKTILLGCSIEPELLTGAHADKILSDLQKYEMIIARESITYDALQHAFLQDALKNKGAKKIPRILQIPDPAFTLNKVHPEIPDGFWRRNTVGVNVSPLIQKSEAVPGITIRCYERLLEWIIEHTDMQIACIPHVVWKDNDDRVPLHALYEEYKKTERIIEIKDGTCEELKGIISECRFFVGARTHATIAAYSTCVPTLVVGYSVKAAGIARDLFETEEHYVLPVQQLKEENDLVTGFQWMMEHEEQIKVHLDKKMPEYIEKAFQTGKEVERLWEELKQQQEI